MHLPSLFRKILAKERGYPLPGRPRLATVWKGKSDTRTSEQKQKNGRKDLRNRNVLFRILAVLAIAGFVVLGSNLVLTARAASDRTVLHGSAPAWANAKNYASAANSSDTVGFRVYLGWNNESAVQALAQAVSDPKSSSYGQYLTPAQFRQQFAPSQAQVGAVQSWLRSQGFSVEYTPQNNHYISAEGTIAQASAAFGVSFGMYNVDGLTVRSPSADLSIPSSLATRVRNQVNVSM